MKTHFNSETALNLAKKQLEKHYEDKYVYALPDWAMLSAEPTCIAVVTVYGTEGITIAKQRVDFRVDFKDPASVSQYADFLTQQMNTALDVVGYVVFFDKKVYLKKDPNYMEELTESQQLELDKQNQQKKDVEISIILLNKNHEPVANLDELASH